MLSATVGSTETMFGRPGNRIAAPASDTPRPAAAAAALNARAMRTESSPGKVSGRSRRDSPVPARRSASTTTADRL